MMLDEILAMDTRLRMPVSRPLAHCRHILAIVAKEFRTTMRVSEQNSEQKQFRAKTTHALTL
jgi:hypothetical protein